MAVAQGSKPIKKASAPPSHPPYIDMITEALISLKERTGSSHHAIAKHIEEQQKIRDLPSNFKKLLSVQLKRFVASGKLVKIKNSFKLPAVAVKTAPVKPKAKATGEKKKAKAVAKPKAKTAAPAKKEKVVKKAVVSVKKVVKNATPLKTKEKKPKSIKSPVKTKAKKPKSIKSPVKKAKVIKKAKK